MVESHQSHIFFCPRTGKEFCLNKTLGENSSLWKMNSALCLLFGGLQKVYKASLFRHFPHQFHPTLQPKNPRQITTNPSTTQSHLLQWLSRRTWDLLEMKSTDCLEQYRSSVQPFAIELLCHNSHYHSFSLSTSSIGGCLN